MTFDDSWYGMRRHRGERGVFIPGEGFRAAPLPPRVSPAPAQPLAPPVPAGSPEAAGEPQSAENGLPDASHLSPPERPGRQAHRTPWGTCGIEGGCLQTRSELEQAWDRAGFS